MTTANMIECEDIAPRRPDPVVERDTSFFWEAAKRGELVTRACTGCGFFAHPPVPMCPQCNGLTWQEKKLSGRGVVTDWMRSHYPPAPMFDYPLLIATVTLDEGLEMATNLIDVDPEQTDYAGMTVQVCFAPTKGGWAVPVFSPVRQQS